MGPNCLVTCSAALALHASQPLAETWSCGTPNPARNEPHAKFRREFCCLLQRRPARTSKGSPVAPKSALPSRATPKGHWGQMQAGSETLSASASAFQQVCTCGGHPRVLATLPLHANRSGDPWFAHRLLALPKGGTGFKFHPIWTSFGEVATHLRTKSLVISLTGYFSRAPVR
jgi:hypothetical protein